MVQNVKKYILDEDNKVSIHDDIIVRHALFPFWMMSNPRMDLGLKEFICFLGCNYPDGIQLSDDDKMWKEALQYMNSSFCADMRKGQPKKRIGWGTGSTPKEAFQSALKLSGAFTSV